MCLTIKPGEKVRIAKEDIIVYKLFFISNKKNPELLSPFRRYLYKVEERAPKVKLTPKSYRSDMGSFIEVSEGYHAFIDKPATEYFIRKANINNSALLYWDVILKCIIPKGTKYYLGRNQDIVSETIIVTLDDMSTWNLSNHWTLDEIKKIEEKILKTRRKDVLDN